MQPGEILTPWVDPRLKSRPSPLGGQGLFALSGPAFAPRTILVGGEYTVQAVERARELGLIE